MVRTAHLEKIFNQSKQVLEIGEQMSTSILDNHRGGF